MSFRQFVLRLEIMPRVLKEMDKRALQASHALRSAALSVLRGQRHGRRYRLPNSRRYYTASAPGEPPAARTGDFRRRWRANPHGHNPAITTTLAWLAVLLEKGSKKRRPDGRQVLEPRPYVEPIKQKAWPKIVDIYRRPYLK